MENYELTKIIEKLIQLKTEGAYWDYKQEWHSNNADLLHDIICMANNIEDMDAYIIIGVDNTGNVCGVPENNRKCQQNLIDFLRKKEFAGGVRPIVYVQSLNIYNEEIDIIIIKNTAYTPYYLTDDYQGLCKGNIYTRVIDTNTPKNETADIDKTEWLWKKRFGLIGTSEHRIKRVLLSDGWMCGDANDFDKYYFNELYPEIRININKRETEIQKGICTAHDSFFYLYANSMFWNWTGNETLRRKCYDVQWYGNKICQFFTISAPKMDFDYVEPFYSFLDTNIGIFLEDGHGLGAAYSYFIEDNIDYMIFRVIFNLQWLDSVMDKYRMSNISDIGLGVIPIFIDKDEYCEFMEHVYENKKSFKTEYDALNVDEMMYSGAKAKSDPRIKQSFKLGKLLVNWLNQWRISFFGAFQ